MRKSIVFGLLLASSVISGSSARGDLLVNGDFEAGNVGFTASAAYTYSETTAGPGHEGVIRNPNDVYGGFFSFGDHTTGSGRMLLVDAAPYSGTPPPFWMETIGVTPNTSYTFTGFAREVGTDPNTAILGLFLGSTQVDAGFTLRQGSQDGAWQQFSFTFDSGSSTSIVLGLADVSPNAAVGNDFVIDDLSLTPTAVPEPASVLLLGIGAAAMAGFGSRSRRSRSSHEPRPGCRSDS